MLFINFYYVKKMRIKPGSAVLKAHRYVCIFGGLYVQSAPYVKLYSKLVARYSHLSGLKSGFNWKRGWRSMFVAIHYIKWNREGILGITPPPHTPHTHTPLSLFFFFFFYYYLPLFVYVVMYIFFREGIIIAALRADWALRLVSERPADYVRLRAETKPAQPLNFTAFGSYSRSSAHFQARCLTTNLRERERARVCGRKKPT